MKVYVKLIFAFLFISGYVHTTNAQKIQNNINISLHAGLGNPVGIMSERFGLNSIAGGGLYWYRANTNLRFGISYDFLFGTNVKEDVVSSLRNENGVFLGVDSGYGNVLLRERGRIIDVLICKTIALNKSNKSSGIELGLGLGLMQHKVRIQIDTRNIPILSSEALQGYQQNVIGPSIKQIIGYHWRSLKSNANASALLEVTEGFTKPTQALNFNTLEVNTERRLDIHIALKVAYYLPLTKTVPTEEIFY